MQIKLKDKKTRLHHKLQFLGFKSPKFGQNLEVQKAKSVLAIVLSFTIPYLKKAI